MTFRIYTLDECAREMSAPDRTRYADGMTMDERRKWPRRGTVDNAPDHPARRSDLGRVIWKGRQWAVTEHGLERHDGPAYAIAADALGTPGENWSWPDHMAMKEWIDWPDFVAAYAVAVLVHRLAAGRVRIPRLDGDR